MMEFDARFGEQVEAFVDGHRISHSRWFPNEEPEWAKLGTEFAFIIATEGNLDEIHKTTTYVIFRHEEERS